MMLEITCSHFPPGSRSATHTQQVLDSLAAAALYELGLPSLSLYYWANLSPSTSSETGPQAAAELQKLLDHHGIVLNEPIGAVAHLGLARADAMQGESAKAKAAYQDFLALWRDAGRDVPILTAAKAEYAKLQLLSHRFGKC